MQQIIDFLLLPNKTMRRSLFRAPASYRLSLQRRWLLLLMSPLLSVPANPRSPTLLLSVGPAARIRSPPGPVHLSI